MDPEYLPEAPTYTLFGAGKAFWRSFVLAWLFPVFFFWGGLLADEFGHPLAFFWGGALPFFFWTNYRAMRPFLERKIGNWALTFWVMLIPFMIWGIAVFGRLIFIQLPS